MDKNNKNRTDLLAAGRKKLQQFRQKKDGKGGKLSGKSSKPEHDANSDAAKSTATSDKVLDEELSVPDAGEVVTSSELNPLNDPLVVDDNVSIIDLSLKDGAGETTLELADEQLRLEDSKHDVGDSKHDVEGAKVSVPFEGGGVTGGHENVELVDSRSLGIFVSDEKSTSCKMQGPVDLSSEVERNREEQEAGSSVSKQTDPGSEIWTQRVVPDAVIHEADRSTQPDDVVASPNVQDEQISDAFGSSSESAQVDGIYKQDAAEVLLGFEDDGLATSFRNNMLKLPSGSDASSISLSQLQEVMKGLENDQFSFVFCSRESLFEKLTSSLGLNGSEIFSFVEKLKQELYLLSFARDANQMQLCELLELEMQLRNRFEKLVGELSVSSSTILEVQGQNAILSEELKQCRSECHEFSSEREELRQQLHASKAGVEEFSALVDNLQNRLEISGGNMSSLASELADCRNLVASLQVENENLNGMLSLVMEEKMKVVEDKENFLQDNNKMAAELARSKASLASLQLDNVNLSECLASVTEEKRKFDEEKEFLACENGKLLSDLSDSNSLVQSLQAENASLSGLLAALEEEKRKLQVAQEYLVQENEKLALNIVDSRILVDGLQMELSDITGSLVSSIEERNKLEEEKQHLSSKNESGSRELLESKSVLAGLQTEFIKAIRDLQEVNLHVEKLSQENVLLRTNIELHIAEMSNPEDTACKVKGTGRQIIASDDISSQIPRTEESQTAISEFTRTSSESAPHGSLPRQIVMGDPDGSSGSEFWKMHLEANEVLQKLENAIEGMHSILASLSSSSGKHVQSGVSKLIHAFETKTIADDHEVDEVSFSESAETGHLFMQAKEQTKSLQVILKQMLLLAESASKSFEGERKSRISAEFLNTQLVASCESLKSHCNHFEVENIELVVLCEALKQHICNSKTSISELVILCKTLQEQEVTLDVENIQLKDKVGSLEAKISEFQSNLDEICQISDQMVSSFFNQVESLQKEVGDRGLLIDKEWNSFVDRIIMEVGKLDRSIETLCSFRLSNDYQKSLDIGSRIAASVNAAIKAIEGLHEQLKHTERDHQAILSAYSELNMKFNNLQEKNELCINVLDKNYQKLRRAVESCGHVEGTTTGIINENLLDPGLFNDLLEKMLDDKLQLQSANDKLNSHLVDQVREIDELKKRSFHLDAILELFQNVNEEFMLGSFSVNTADPVPGLESFVNILIEKYKEAKEQVSLAQEKPDLNELQLGYFQKELDHLTFILVQYENENLVLKESWKTVKEDIPAFQAELQERIAELEQSEHRVSSLREKLSIAVTKGKGLIVQRDNLKQSLAETSNRLAKCSQDLQSKDVVIHELETKLQNYSEAGERMEALKSELAYIRNSATALRESFLLKDSILQRIEEILEDLELPEHFHSRDIIEKVDWLAKSITANMPPLTDWDQKSPVGGECYPESGFASVDGWKEETQQNQDLADDFRRRYEELQGKFYGLAEHNEMLEQSLIERNNLVQRWEDILGKIEMPLQLRPLEPEDRIQWLGGALLDTQNHCKSLQQRIDYFDALNISLTGDLEESQSRISELESAYHSIIVEKECLLKNLETITNDCQESSEKASQLEFENEKLLKQVTCLQEKLDQKLVDKEHLNHVEAELGRLQDLIHNVLQDSVTDDLEFASNSMEHLELLLRILIDKYSTLLVGNLVTDGHVNEKASVTDHEEQTRDSGVTEDVAALSKKLEDTLAEVVHLKEERDGYSEKNQSLVTEVEELDAKRKELQELLNHEEQKSASLREKLNIAVKKGKSLVQQRDNLKQIIDEVNAEVDRLKFEVSLRENSIAEYEHRIMNLSISHERLKNVEAECASLRDRLSDSERCLHEKEYMLSLILESLKVIDVGFDSGNPVQKLEAIGKKYLDLNAALDSSLQESRKSKRAAELLLAELNEVQERNDALQEDLAKVARELSEVSREKEFSEAAKFEALAHVEKLSAVQSEEKDHLLAEVSILRSSVDQMQEEISTVNSSLAEVLSKDLEILQNLEASIKSCLELPSAPSTDARSAIDAFAGIAVGDSSSITFPKSRNKVPTTEIGFIKELLQRHHNSIRERASHIFEIVKGLYTEVSSLKESSEYGERNLHQIESILKNKDSELFVARRNISLLYEACSISIMEIENRKSQEDGIDFSSKASWVDLNSQTFVGGNTSTEENILSSEEVIMSVREKLLSVVKDLISRQNEILEDRKMEWKTIVSNLQKELHEKDIQRERIGAELVSQIKDAEVMAKNYLQDLRSATTRADDLQSQVNGMEEEHSMLKKRVKDLEYQETVSADLQQRVASLTDALAAKDQEIEALMQALDEEESQMEGLSNKILELESDLQKKNQDLENLEASRGRVLKKLSVTVSKFDELHHLSESLLSEVEKLQLQLQERDGEISFLRQEVTRCTNEALTATQMSNKRNSDEALELLTWLDTTVSRVQVRDMPPTPSDAETNQVREHKELLQKQIESIVSELEELQTVAQNREFLLKGERSRVEELIREVEFLENALLEKDSQLTMLRRVSDSGQATSPKSEIVEVESLINKRAASGSIAPQVRGGRKTNSDQVAIAIDMDPVSGIEDDDDDKAHGFKSLTTSRIVPRFTRPVSDMIDGLWMSCDRTLMRQPTLRLGVIIYWAILHALLATYVV